MKSHPFVELGELMPKEGRSSINPAEYPDEVFDLLSIPAYDRGAPERASGSEIGSTKQLVQPGDVLLSKIVPHIRRAWVVGPAVNGRQIASSEWIVFRGHHSDPRYLRHFFLSDGFHRQFMQTVSGVGGSLLRARPKYVAKIKTPLPPLEEQRRIAAILDKTAEISDANKRRQNLLKAFPLSVYTQMLGDPRQNPFQWPVFSLGEICLNEDARRVPVKSSDRKAMQGRFPYYGASGIIDNVDSYLFEGQRLLVGEDGANLLARSSPIAFIADGKYWVNNHAHVLGENGKAKLRFLEYYFALVDLKPFVTGSAQPKLTRSALDSLPVPLPPLDLQERFESVLAAMNITLAQAKTSNEQALRLSNALRHMSFHGESA
jgi:type I restriction enzyme S subunit